MFWWVLFCLLSIAVLFALVMTYHGNWQTVSVKTSTDIPHDVLYIGYLSDQAIETLGGGSLVPGSAFVIAINYKENTMGTSGFGKIPVTNTIPNLTQRLRQGQPIETTFDLGNHTNLKIRFIPHYKTVNKADCEVYFSNDTMETVSMAPMKLIDINKVHSALLVIAE